jgi:hypothetical protein
MPFAGKQSQTLLGFHTPPHKSYLRAITLRGLEILWQAIKLSRQERLTTKQLSAK